MTELSAGAQAVVDLADYVAGEEFQNCLTTLQSYRLTLPECPARDHVWGAAICLNNLAGRAPDEALAFNPPVPEPVDGPELP